MQKVYHHIEKIIARLSGHEIHTREMETAVIQASNRIIEASVLGSDKVLSDQNTSSNGLTSEEARHRLKQFGKNEIAHEKAPAWYRQLLSAFIDPFIGILIILATASFLTEYVFAPPAERDLTALIIISILILVSVILTFIQEYQASQAAEKLLSLVQNTAMVERSDTGIQKLPTNEIVPGDIIHLAAGDIIPADVRLIELNNLSVNEAALTGESLPVEKFATSEERQIEFDKLVDFTDINALDLDNIGFMSTDVVSGSAKAIVLSTGNDTYFGSMSEELVGHHPPTNFDIGVKNVSLMLIRLMLVMVPIIFLINGFVRGEWFQALLFSLAVAVGLTPEMLPTIVTANLAKGTIEMAQRKTIVKRLNAIQNLGAMDVLCTDKTGTLTYDSVALEAYLNIQGEEDAFVLHHTQLNSYFQTGLRNPLDDAVMLHPVAENYPSLNDYNKITEIPFQTERRRVSVIVENQQGEPLLICKGAIDEMLSISTKVERDGEVSLLTPELQKDIIKRANNLIEGGLRVLLVAYKPVVPGIVDFQKEDENDLILIGFVGFFDPPKETSGAAISALNKRGVRVVVITGDNEIATRRICREIGFGITDLYEGHQIDQMTAETLSPVVEKANVFVRTAPLQKSKILNALKHNGHAVGFLGDGINDAPALRDADVGISVDNAVDIAKESADILLLEKSLMVLEEGVGRGRLVFGNIMKYIKMTVSSNFGNVFSVLVASIFLPFPPMLPLHLLIQNMLYDVSQLAIPWDHVDDEFIIRPRKWDPKSITRFTVFIGPVSSIFDFTTFALLWFVFSANTVGQQSLFHSGWFVLGLLSQTLIVHMIRTSKIPFIQSTASKPVIIMTVAVMIIGLVIPFTGFGTGIGLEPLPPIYFLWLTLTLIGYCALIQLVKTLYVRRFNTWL